MGRGVLRPDLAATHLRLDRHKPSDALAPFVDYYWIPRWDLRGRPPFEQTILPHPNVHLVFEASGAGMVRTDRERQARWLPAARDRLGAADAAAAWAAGWTMTLNQAREFVRSRYSWDIVARRYLQAFMKVSQARGEQPSEGEE